MVDNLVIVESPAKAKTIEKFLGKDFLVKSSFGHIRDLAKKEFGIDIKNEYTPNYIISQDKKKVVGELKKLAKEAKVVWLASDEDREGEAIAWHLAETLKIPEEKTRRIVFHEITKEAILKAITEPRAIDRNLVNAQQARRVLDRLVGFELSPVLWKKIKPSLSAGRVQSVAVRLLVDREREIIAFKPTASYKISAIFSMFDENGQASTLKTTLNKSFNKREEAEDFLEKCKDAAFTISKIETKPSRKSPSPPFTTSTLQQEASRKFGFSVAQTMTLAQRLYEAGRITYMRTDSFNLSQLALNTAKTQIESEYGEKYSKVRQYKTKSKGAQEAHEAIRPTYINKSQVPGNANEKKLYQLIWKRTVASQMSDAELEKTQIAITISNRPELFTATGEVLIFDGFLKVYLEETDDEKDNNGNGMLPAVKKGQEMVADTIEAMQRYSQYPPRFTEASLVKKLEEMGIGRPSTYAPTISTIQARDYVVKEDRPGFTRELDCLTLRNNQIIGCAKTENTHYEKAKLFPTDIGMVVSDFLIEHFSDIMDYNFTANVEKQFDNIAGGNRVWFKMIDEFYKPFHERVEETTKTSSRSSGERSLGKHPETGEPVIVKIGRYGPMAQIGEGGDDKKPRFARLRKEHFLETISLEEALELFKLPRQLGDFEDKIITVGIGRFGPYVRHDNKFFSLKKGVDDPMKITTERAIELINEKREAEKKKVIQIFEGENELRVLRGRYGPYISYEGKNYRIPKTVDPEKLKPEECMEIIKKTAQKPKKS